MDYLLLLFFLICFSMLVGLVGKNRRIGFGAAFLLSLILSPLIGLIITLFSKKISNINQTPRYVQYYELAMKEEFKGNLEQAISFYMDSLFYFKNDFPNPKGRSKKFHQNKIHSLQSKIDELKSKKQNSLQN